MGYACIFKLDERADHEALYNEFLTARPELLPVVNKLSTWTGVRVFDRIGVDRLDEFPVLSKLIEERFGRENVVMVNYYNLAAGAVQHEHRDQAGNLLLGISRVHVPLVTNPGAKLLVERKPYHMDAGEVWSLDTSGRHAAHNSGSSDRVHLVVDVRRAPQTARYFPRMTLAVRLHLAKFCAILATMVARDLVTRPATILDRLRHLKASHPRPAGRS